MPLARLLFVCATITWRQIIWCPFGCNGVTQLSMGTATRTCLRYRYPDYRNPGFGSERCAADIAASPTVQSSRAA